MDPLKIIIIDDTEDIHSNIKTLFTSKNSQEALDKLSQEIFGKVHQPDEEKSKQNFNVTIDSAYQGKQGFEMIEKACQDGEPYAVAVVDMRMPPGWDGLKTIEKIREVDQNVEIIISSAYSDYSWQDIADRLGVSDKYLFLSKPFEVAEMKQMIVALGEKWRLVKQNREQIEELERARLMVEGAIKAKEDFLGVMSHELRTPLNIIIMTIEDFLETEEDADNKRILKNSEESAKYLAQLIDNIMYFIHLDSHNFRPDISNFSCSEILEEIEDQFESKAKERGLELVTKAPSLAMGLKADRKRLYSALYQLVDNAIKFSDEGQITVTIEETGKGINSTNLRFTVQDTGIGMGPQEQKHACDLFYQGESTNHHSRTGTGVGLSLCQKIVESFGGKLTVSSELGKGSQFQFEISVETDAPAKKRLA